MTAGAAWKEKRESLGKTLEDVSGELRISLKYIEGIESGDFEGWPPRVFSQGFIRSYASLLGVEPEPVLEEFRLQQAEEPPGHDDPKTGPLPAWRREDVGRRKRTVWYGYIAGAVLVAALLVTYVSHRWERHRSIPAPVPRAVPGAPPPQATLPRAPAPAAVVQADNSALPAAAAPPASRSGNQTEEGYFPIPAAGPYHLLLEAVEESWVAYSADDGKVSDTTLSPGDNVNVPARSRIYLRLGNAGGVSPSLNGRRIAPFGKRGQVMTIRIGPPPSGGAEASSQRSPAKAAASPAGR